MSSRGVTKYPSMKAWLGSKAPGSGGGGGKFLSGWKDQKTGKGEVTTWLHVECLPMTVWRHPFPMLIVIDDKKTGTKVTHVWSRSHTCHETEDVLAKMWWRKTKGDPTSERDTPPERCGLCKTTEWLWQQSWLWLSLHRWVSDKDESGETKVTGHWSLNKLGKKAAETKKPLGLDPCTVLFDFVSEADADENTTVHVGGYCGLFGRDELPDDLLKAMAAAKIRQNVAWKENGMVKPKSVMCVVDNDKPEKGVQISEETKELGEKVKEEITKVWDGSEINVQQRPYAIRWNYDRSKNMGKQYTATAVMKIKPDARILAAIRGEKPDLSHLETSFNQQQMKAIFERHCKIKDVPWSDLFPSKEQEKDWAEEDEATTTKAPKGDESEPDVGDADEEVSDVDTDEEDEEDEAEEDEDGEELVGCDSCKKPHKISATKCPHCGHAYEVEEEPDVEEEPEEVKPVRSRSEAKKAATGKVEKPKKSSSAKKAPAAKPKSEPEVGENADEDEDEDADQEDSIPF